MTLSNNAIVILNVREAKSFWEKTVGLIGKPLPSPLLIRTRFGIHTFGLKFPIDVLVLDKDNVVRGVKENLVPNRLFFWNPSHNAVVELPQGTIAEKKIEIGEEVSLS